MLRPMWLFHRSPVTRIMGYSIVLLCRKNRFQKASRPLSGLEGLRVQRVQELQGLGFNTCRVKGLYELVGFT